MLVRVLAAIAPAHLAANRGPPAGTGHRSRGVPQVHRPGTLEQCRVQR
ncbi:hypothetical protein ACFPIJ_61720 [Dactylosporangium cerinum]|uniref:Uncharacterized protein n=1 Tax=Dactylosporangium cerinum TaxID=1434730 RepID=A0ABV9WLF6_9ACTN